MYRVTLGSDYYHCVVESTSFVVRHALHASATVFFLISKKYIKIKKLSTLGDFFEI
jgi:hypothetical protein